MDVIPRVGRITSFMDFQLSLADLDTLLKSRIGYRFRGKEFEEKAQLTIGNMAYADLNLVSWRKRTEVHTGVMASGDPTYDVKLCPVDFEDVKNWEISITSGTYGFLTRIYKKQHSENLDVLLNLMNHQAQIYGFTETIPKALVLPKDYKVPPKIEMFMDKLSLKSEEATRIKIIVCDNCEGTNAYPEDKIEETINLNKVVVIDNSDENEIRKTGFKRKRENFVEGDEKILKKQKI